MAVVLTGAKHRSQDPFIQIIFFDVIVEWKQVAGLHQRQGRAWSRRHYDVGSFARDDRHPDLLVTGSTGQHIEGKRGVRMRGVNLRYQIFLHDPLLVGVSASLIPQGDWSIRGGKGQEGKIHHRDTEGTETRKPRSRDI